MRRDERRIIGVETRPSTAMKMNTEYVSDQKRTKLAFISAVRLCIEMKNGSTKSKGGSMCEDSGGSTF